MQPPTAFGYHRPVTEAPVQPEQDLPDDPQPDTFMDVFGRLGVAGWLALFWAVAPAAAGFVLLARMKPVAAYLLGETGQAGGRLGFALAVYVLAFMAAAGLGVLPTYSVSVLGGYVFGVPLGFAAALAGFGGASVVGYFVARRVAREQVEKEIHRHAKAVIVRDALVASGFWKTLLIVTLVRMPPNSPFALMNLTLASTGVRFRTYLIGTLVGMAPRTVVYCVIGHQVRLIGSDIGDLHRPKWLLVAGVVLMVGVLSVISAIGNHALKRVTGAGAAPEA